MNWTYILIIIAFAAGFPISYFVWDKALLKKKNKIISDAEAESEVIKKEKILQAKEKFLQLKSEHEKFVNERNNKLFANENKLKQAETTFNQRRDEVQRKAKELETEKHDLDIIRENLTHQLEIIDQRNEEIEKMHRQQVEQLQIISGYSAVEAKNQLVESLKNEAKTEAMSYIQEIMDEAKLNANKEAKKIIVKSIQRVASEAAI